MAGAIYSHTCIAESMQACPRAVAMAISAIDAHPTQGKLHARQQWQRYVFLTKDATPWGLSVAVCRLFYQYRLIVSPYACPGTDTTRGRHRPPIAAAAICRPSHTNLLTRNEGVGMPSFQLKAARWQHPVKAQNKPTQHLQRQLKPFDGHQTGKLIIRFHVRFLRLTIFVPHEQTVLF